MTANYVLLEKVTLSANAASVVLDNIPQTGYTDLKIVVSARDTVDNQASIKFNSSTTGYSNIRLQGTGSAVQSTTDSSTSKGIIAYSVNQTSSRPANTFGNAEIYIPNYAGSTNKSFSSDGVEENNGTAAYSKFFAGLLANPAAIESITLSAEGVFEAGSTFSLYGLAAVGTTPEIAPFASGGDIVTNDGTYWIHTFLSSGTFTPAKALTCDYLVVAGGGGGGKNVGGGGGAGGLQTSTSTNLTPTAYVVTVGGGGAGGGPADIQGISGSNSILSSVITSTGGGGGGGAGEVQGLNGGSGGGSSYNGNIAGGLGTAGQGNNGGSSIYFVAGGGGGAGGVGANATGSGSGAGGIGATSSLINAFATATSTGVYSAPNYYYAGGGGGGGYTPQVDGAGGIGGGGAGGGTPTAGTRGTGGGGGGNAGGSGYGPNGASGG